MNIVFHGEDVATFIDGFADQLGSPAVITALPRLLDAAADRSAFASADVLVANRFVSDMPVPAGLRLLHVPAAGCDGIDMAAVPADAAICNSFGHEQAIAEYVMAALLARCVPLADADARLRRGDWSYQAGAPERVHAELSELTVGLFGFGHIGQTVAARARAFGMAVVAANRSPVPPTPLADRTFGLDDPAFWAAADAVVVSLPLTDSTRGIVGAAQLAAMRPGSVLLNVGRGPVVDEQALYDALATGRIDAVIDTWYQYPSAELATPLPGSLPFHDLPNLVMTPHMSGWTAGTIRRRRDLIARNVRHLEAGEALENVVRGAASAHPAQQR